MELKAEHVKNIRSLALCKEFLRQAVEQVDKLESDYEEACGRLQTANLINDEQLAATRHQKYKRCLAMAKWCNERYILDDCLYELGKTRFYDRWENRWLNIAKQFKESK